MKALEGIRVLDLTHALAGPFCTYHLQLLGAEVIKIERPKLGDDFRDFARLPGWDVSPSFVAVNGGKRSVTVNLKDPDGQAIIRRLAAQSDVVVENLRPGAANELHVGWDDLHAENPRLVYCSISGFGQHGEMSTWPAYDHTIQAMAGMSWSGRDDDIPSQGRAFSVDCFTGYVAFAQILGALLRRERSGEGQYLDVAMLDASLVLLAVGSVRQLITGDSISAAQPIVHDRPTVAPYRTRDGWLWLSVNFPHQFEVFCRVIHAEDLLDDPRFSTPRARTENSTALKAELARRLATCSAEELEPRLMEAGCPAARVRTTREVLQMPVLAERGMLQTATVPNREQPVTLVNAGFVADKDGPCLHGGVPELGADTDAVLRRLGYSETDIAHLRERGAV